MPASHETNVAVKFHRPLRSFDGNHLPRKHRWGKRIASIVILGILLACEAAGVPETNDPAEKLTYARLLLRDNRPLPAERLIDESMEIYQSRGDRAGLADAQYRYGWFLAGDAVELMADWYRENGFQSSSVTFESRQQESAKYFQLAATGFTQTANFAKASNAYFDLGLAQSQIDKTESACAAYRESLKSFYTYFQQDPAAEVNLPKGISSYEEYVIPPAAAAGCPIATAATDQSNGGQRDRDSRKLALTEEAVALAESILGPDHPAVFDARKFREGLIKR